MFIIINISSEPVMIDGVSLIPGEQISVLSLSEDMIAARNLGTLRILMGDETSEEKKADVDAIEDSVAASDKILGNEGEK